MGIASASGKMLREAAKDTSKAIAEQAGKAAEAIGGAFEKGSKTAAEAVEAGYKKGINKYAQIFADDYADTAVQWKMRANKLYDKAAGRMTPAVISGSGSDAINKTVKNVDKLKRANTIKGSLIGGVGGAGLGGLTGVVTGADEDNQKAMTVGGAIGGAIIGGFTGNVLGGSGRIIGGSTKAISKGASEASAAVKSISAKADEAVEVASNIAKNNATTAYSGINHANNLSVVTNVPSLSSGSVAFNTVRNAGGGAMRSTNGAMSTAQNIASEAFDEGLRTYDGGFIHSISGNTARGPALLTDSGIVGDTVARDIIPESHRIGNKIGLPGAIALDGGQMMVG